MFDKILIANRGEIACRVIETCRRVGVGTVAVFSNADGDARHVHMADEAVGLGGYKPVDSYLRGDLIIDAALKIGAQAIHPGYGFLSENPEFVEAVGAAGLVFIGPSATAIRAMGLKGSAKSLMADNGVPVVPGYHGTDQSTAHLAVEAATIGYPVLIKAVAGGGGKGMRLVEAEEDFLQALSSAKSEAQSAFGNDIVLIEKYVQKPRHIEVQIFGDGTRAVHLFERDCSLQRRHQKVIEEAPAPGMTDDMRAAMGQAAVRAAEAIGYAGAGTVEFIVDASDGLRPDRFWFMEMNTRLQVEHPVTEAITGQDLVEWQLLVAAGEPLPVAQEDVVISGHAFEARVYAEDVPAGFLPATGRLTHLVFPSLARADTGVRTGDEISPWYDPMIAKLIVHGSNRAQALQKLRRALATTELAGTVTNMVFLQALAEHTGFASGDVDTGLIARDLPTLTVDPTPGSQVIALAALTALGLDGEDPLQGFHLWHPMRQFVTLIHNGTEVNVQIEALGGGAFSVSTNSIIHKVERGHTWKMDGAAVPARAVCHGAGISVFWDRAFHFETKDPLAVTREADVSGRITAPMPGSVRVVHTVAAAQVSKGDPLVVLEAMKMEHVLTAPDDGVVAEVLVSDGDQVEAGASLIVMEGAE